MRTVDVGKAMASLDELLDETTASHEPIQITGKGAAAVLVSEEDWRAVRETLYLLSVPGMRESIREGIKTPLNERGDCSREPGW